MAGTLVLRGLADEESMSAWMQRAARVFERLDEPIANAKRGRARPRVEARSNESGVTPAMASSLQIVSLRSPG